ncbi:MAG: phosphoribosylglycinamide formyltransferase [Bacteroidota bacterium]
MSKSPLRIAVFASGSGTNLEAILQAIEERTLRDVAVTAVVSNRSNAGALERANQRGIATAVMKPASFDSEAAYVEALNALFSKNNVNFVVLAGYLKKIPLQLVRQFQGRMLNIHPSLLPAFGGPGMYGAKIHQAALDRGVRWTGVTVHFVDEDYDTGPIMLQRTVPVYQNDAVETLASRVLAVEHQIFPEALRLIAEGRVTVTGRQVSIDPLIPKDTASNQ